MRTRAIPVIVLLILVACPLAAAEFRPVAVWTDAEWYPNPPGKYAPGKMIDGDLGTYACLLDDTRTGKDMQVFPPQAAPPVTATFVLDLGTEHSRRTDSRLHARFQTGRTALHGDVAGGRHGPTRGADREA